MKKFLIMAVTAIAVLSGCSSENDITPAGKVFTARFEGVSSRATLNGMTPNWETTDQISINGAIYTPKTAGAQVDLQATGADAEGDTYTAYFPASISSGTLPSTINETYGKFNMPMYANSTSTNLEFKNLCGVLAITVKSDQIAAVKSIRVSSKDKAVSGAFTVSGNAAVLTDASTVANTVTVNYSTAEATTAEGKVFYVAIPAQTYQELKMELSADGTDFSKSMTTKAATDITVERNKIYPITFADNAVQPAKWEKNLTMGDGATSVVIEINKTKPASGYNDLNALGTLWEVREGAVLKIQTSSNKIIGSNPIDERGLFQGLSAATTISGLENVDMSQVTSMASMFFYCNSLATLDLSSFDTSNVTDMSFMFGNCGSLPSINLSSFNTSNVVTMRSMFQFTSFTGLDLSNFDTRNVTDMADMFLSCNVNTLDLTSFNTEKVSNMSQMFMTSTIVNLNLSSFDIRNVDNVSLMFEFCENLKTLVLSNKFKIKDGAETFGMFMFCGDDCTVKGVTDESVKSSLQSGTEWEYGSLHFE